MLLLRIALRLAARRPAPDTIPRTGPRTKGLDCYTAYIEAVDESWALLIDSVDRNGTTGRLLVDGKYERPYTVLWGSLDQVRVEFIHYVGPYEFRYHSSFAFLRAELFAWPKFFIYRNSVEQFFFNRRRLARTERVEALRLLVERTLNDPQFRTSPPQFLSDVYTRRSFSHPDKDRHLAYARMLLDSLVDSGDLSRENISYSVKPQALLSLSVHEEEERRHRDNVKNQRRLTWLTFSLVLVGMVQVMVAYLRG